MQAAYVGYIGAPIMTGTRVLKEFGLTGIPVQHVENASATGAAAFREAYLAVAGGHVDVAMAKMVAAGARATSTEMALFEMLEQAGTSEFKSISKLVR